MTAVFIEENPPLIERAEPETTMAERLNAGLGQIHLTRGFILFSWYRGWRLIDAIRANRRAVELDPGLSDNELDALMYHVGLFDEWEATNRRAIDIDPTNQQLKRASVNEFFLVNRPSSPSNARAREHLVEHKTFSATSIGQHWATTRYLSAEPDAGCL